MGYWMGQQVSWSPNRGSGINAFSSLPVAVAAAFVGLAAAVVAAAAAAAAGERCGNKISVLEPLEQRRALKLQLLLWFQLQRSG